VAVPARTVERRPAGDGRPPVEVVRSTRRRRSASAYARDGVVVVQLPAHLSRREQERLIGELVDQVTGQARIAAAGGDAALMVRARRLADTYLDAVRPTSVRWSGRMRRRFGSCTPEDGSIRISRELAAFPDYVLDYVIVHELAHLVHADHSPAFESLVARYPDTARARAFLDGFTAGTARGAMAADDDAVGSGPGADD